MMKVSVWAFEHAGVQAFSGKVSEDYCSDKQEGGISNNYGNVDGEFFLNVNGKNYRFQINQDGNIVLPMINGASLHVTTYAGWSAVELTPGG